MTAIEQTSQYRMGRRGEIIACALFGSEGWGTIPTAEIGGPDAHRAPVQLQLGAGGVVLPDIDISKVGAPRMWIDAKTKSRFFVWRKTRRSQTGIEGRHLHHYRRIEMTTGAPVALCMIDKTTGDVLCNTLSGLGEPRYSPSEEYPLANWDRERFHLLWRVNNTRLKRFLEHPVLPPQITRDVLVRTLEFLRPQAGDQGELPLFHSDVLAEFARLQMQRRLAA